MSFMNHIFGLIPNRLHLISGNCGASFKFCLPLGSSRGVGHPQSGAGPQHRQTVVLQCGFDGALQGRVADGQGYDDAANCDSLVAPYRLCISLATMSDAQPSNGMCCTGTMAKSATRIALKVLSANFAGKSMVMTSYSHSRVTGLA